MKKIFVFGFLFLAVGAAFVALPADAANPLGKALGNLDSSVGRTGLSSDLAGTVSTIIKALLATVGTIFFGLTIYAGILWMTAAGNDEKIEKAKNIIQAAIIGLAITMSAYAITSFVGSRVGGGAGGGSSGSPCETGGGTCLGATATCPTGTTEESLSCIGSAADGGKCCK